MTAVFVGVALAVGAVLFAHWLGLDRERGFYPTVLTVIAFLYSLFAVMGGSNEALLQELAAGLGFVMLVVVGFRRNLWWVVAGLALHGVFDFLHPHLIDDPGVPPWWPGFCLAYDVVAAAGLAWLIRRGTVRA